MRLSTLTNQLETEQKATARVAYAIAADRWLSNDPLEAFVHRGHARYAAFAKSAVEAVSADDTAVALAGLTAALLAAVDRESVLGQLSGALVVPVGTVGRIMVGTVTAQPVAENVTKPVGRLDFEFVGPPSKIVAEIVMSIEAFRALDLKVQDAIRQHLVAATAAATDTALVAALTAGSPAGSSEPGALLEAIAGGAPRRPLLLGSFTSLLALTPGLLRELRDLNVQVIATPAAGDNLIALDASGLLVGDGGAELATGTDADILFDDGIGSPAGTTVKNLWQSNLRSLRCERFLQFAFRPDAVAFAEAAE